MEESLHLSFFFCIFVSEMDFCACDIPIPEDVIRRRFAKGLSNLVHLYLPICDSVTVWDNTKGEASLVAKQTVETGILEIIDQTMWNYLLQEI